MADKHLPIVAWGQEEALAANEGRIVEKVRRRYAPRLASAGFFRRLYLHFLMRREVRRELERVAPKGGLYLADIN